MPPKVLVFHMFLYFCDKEAKTFTADLRLYLFMSGGFIYGQNAFRSVYICSSCFFDLL